MAEIRGATRPDDRTVGAIGDVYVYVKTGERFKCVDTREIKTHESAVVYYVWIPVRTGTTSGDNSCLPAVTAEDAGKFLRVSETGTWVAEDSTEDIVEMVSSNMINAEGVSF